MQTATPLAVISQKPGVEFRKEARHADHGDHSIFRSLGHGGLGSPKGLFVSIFWPRQALLGYRIGMVCHCRSSSGSSPCLLQAWDRLTPQIATNVREVAYAG